jgi:hypothetical protein
MVCARRLERDVKEFSLVPLLDAERHPGLNGAAAERRDKHPARQWCVA